MINSADRAPTLIGDARRSLDAELRNGVVVVSHDATRTGAPFTALNIARELVEVRGIPVVIILLEPGALEPEFARIGPLFVARRSLAPEYYQKDPRPWVRLLKRAIYMKESVWHDRFWRRIVKYLAKRKIRYAVCNTVLSGGAAVRLKDAGVASIGLIHELPHTIRTYNWTDRAAALIQGTRALVFACPQAQAAFTGAFSTTDKPSYVHPQSFNINSDELTGEQRSSARSTFRARLGLTGDDILILGGGTGDLRKGIDLFVRAACQMALSLPMPTSRKIVFAWAGQIDALFLHWAEKDVIELGLSDRLIFLGQLPDMAPCFAAADIFFLPSREDAFPNVVLEAMAGGLPVVGFTGSGGIEEQVRGGAGVTVPYGDVTSAVKTLRQLAEQPGERDRMGRVGREKIARWGDFHTYVGHLIDVLLAECHSDRPPIDPH